MATYSWDQGATARNATQFNAMAAHFSNMANRANYNADYEDKSYVMVFFSGSVLLDAFGIQDEGPKDDVVGILTNWLWVDDKLQFEYLGVDENGAPVDGMFETPTGLFEGLSETSSVAASRTAQKNDLLDRIGYDPAAEDASITFWFLMDEADDYFYQAILKNNVYLLGLPCPPICYDVER